MAVIPIEAGNLSPVASPGQPAGGPATAAVRSLPQDVLDALDDLYTPDQREQWLTRYALTCRRKRAFMVYLALKQAGYAN